MTPLPQLWCAPAPWSRVCRHSSGEFHRSDGLPHQSYEHRRPAKAPHEGRFVLQVDRQTKESFQTREDAQKAGMALKRAFPILHVGVLDVEEGQSEVIVPPSV